MKFGIQDCSSSKCASTDEVGFRTFLKPCPHCRRKMRLLHKSETVAENGKTTATVSLFCDGIQSHFSATVWTGFKWIDSNPECTNTDYWEREMSISLPGVQLPIVPIHSLSMHVRYQVCGDWWQPMIIWSFPWRMTHVSGGRSMSGHATKCSK